MGQLATSIAHEVNQPLAAIASNAEAAIRLLSAAPPDLADVRGAMADIVKDAKRAGEVIARTHSMLKRQRVDYGPQDVNALIEGIRPVLANYAVARHVGLEIELGRDLPAVQGHGVQLQQVITNLLMNAIDAVPDAAPPVDPVAGRVGLTTSADGQGGAVVVRVTDNGVGLSPEALARIFEPFYTTKAKGLGMGLSIARTIVEAHGGRLWATANPDRGATFCFMLPARQEEPT
jgi:signal transduction histidine kinase